MLKVPDLLGSPPFLRELDGDGAGSGGGSLRDRYSGSPESLKSSAKSPAVEVEPEEHKEEEVERKVVDPRFAAARSLPFRPRPAATYRADTPEAGKQKQAEDTPAASTSTVGTPAAKDGDGSSKPSGAKVKAGVQPWVRVDGKIASRRSQPYGRVPGKAAKASPPDAAGGAQRPAEPKENSHVADSSRLRDRDESDGRRKGGTPI